MCHHRIGCCQIPSDHLCNAAVASTTRQHPAIPDTRNDASKMSGVLVHGREGAGGAACESVTAASQSLREHKYHLVASKMDPRAVSPRIRSAQVSCQMASFTRWVSGTSKPTQLQYAVAWLNSSRRWNGGWGWSYPFNGRNHDNTK